MHRLGEVMCSVFINFATKRPDFVSAFPLTVNKSKKLSQNQKGNMHWLIIAFVAFPFSALGATCPNISPLGYYNPTANGGYQFTFGAPPPNVFYNFELQPPWINECQLNNLHQMCVDTINEYRAGTLVFSNGQSDPTLGNPPPLSRTNVLDRCHSGKFFL